MRGKCINEEEQKRMQDNMNIVAQIYVNFFLMRAKGCKKKKNKNGNC